MAVSYVINVWTLNLAAKVTMNDCTVLRVQVPSDRTEQYDLSSFVIEKEPNRVHAELSVFTQDQKLVGKGTRFFQIHLHRRDDPKRELSVHTLLAAFRWTANESALPVDGSPVDVFSHAFQVHEDDTHGRWSWQDAQPFVPGRDEKAVGALVQRVHSGLVTRHMGMLHTIFDTRYKELSRAEGVSFHEVKQRTEAFFKPYFEADDWRVKPLDLGSVRYETEAGGRLVRAFGADGFPALIGSGGGNTFVQDIAMANLDGVWVAVR